MSQSDERTVSLELTDHDRYAIVHSIDDLLSTEPCPISQEFKGFMRCLRTKIHLSESTVELTCNEAFSICGFIFAVEDREWAKGYKEVRNKIETAFIGKPIDMTNIKIG